MAKRSLEKSERLKIYLCCKGVSMAIVRDTIGRFSRKERCEMLFQK